MNSAVGRYIRHLLRHFKVQIEFLDKDLFDVRCLENGHKAQQIQKILRRAGFQMVEGHWHPALNGSLTAMFMYNLNPPRFTSQVRKTLIKWEHACRFRDHHQAKRLEALLARRGIFLFDAFPWATTPGLRITFKRGPATVTVSPHARRRIRRAR